LAVIALPALLAFAAPPSAHAAWTAPIPIATQDDFPSESVAFDPSGNAIFAYDTGERIQTRVLYANGTLSAPQYVSPTGEQGASNPLVAVDQGGNAVYVWRASGVQIRVRFANGSMSTTKTLSDPGQEVYNPNVAVDPNGNATAVWQSVGSAYRSIQARRRSASGALGPLLTISDPKNADTPAAHVAVDQSGNAIFVFGRYDGSSACGGGGCMRVQTRVLSAGGTLSAPQILSPAGQHAHFVQLGLDQNGNAIFAWTRQDGTTDCNGTGCLRVQARVRRRDGTLSIVQTLSDPGQNSYGNFLAVNQLGTAAFVWARETAATCFDNDPCLAVQTRVRRAGGALSAVQTLTSSKPDAEAQRVGIDREGNSVYLWIAAATSRSNVLRARTRSSSGTLGTPETLSNAGALSPIEISLAVRPNGTALAAWYDYTVGDRLDAAFGP
jgi:hypothetical protein